MVKHWGSSGVMRSLGRLRLHAVADFDGIGHGDERGEVIALPDGAYQAKRGVSQNPGYLLWAPITRIISFWAYTGVSSF